MGKIILAVLLALVVAVGSAMIWQHWRYLRLRRGVVQDRQPVLHSSDAFHTVVFLLTKPGAGILEEVRAFKQATEGSEAQWIYAGKSVVPALASEQMPHNDWNAIVLMQYPSREAYDRHARSDELKNALARFEETYTQGFDRSPFLNVMLPQFLLGMRTAQIVRGQPSYFPFVPAENLDRFDKAQKYGEMLLAERELGKDAIVIVNLTKDGTPEERAANAKYGRPMLGAMAELGYGPMHMGAAVQVEKNYDLDHVMIVYYPGVQFFADMMTSEFYQAIFGDKQLADTQAIITVPILDRL